MHLRVPLNTFPDLVLGNLSTISANLNDASGPISFLISATSSLSNFLASTICPYLITTRPTGISPRRSSLFATTAASTTSLCLSKTSSIYAVLNLWPAVLIISSILVIICKYPSSSKYPASYYNHDILLLLCSIQVYLLDIFI